MYWSGPNRLIFNATLAKLETTGSPRKATSGYIDINCIVNGNGIYPLEFTAQLRLSDDHASRAMDISMPMGEFLYGMAERHRCTEFKTKQRLPDRRTGGRAAISVQRSRRHLNANSKDRVIIFQASPQLEGVHIEDVKPGEWTSG